MTSYRRQARDFGHHYVIEIDEEKARRNYERARKKSTSRKPSMRRREQIRMSKKDFLQRLKAVAGVAAVSTTLLIGTGNLAIHQIRDAMVRQEAILDFQTDYISPETHRTDDGQYFYYDYEDIAKSIINSEDFDESVYLLYCNVGENQTDRVLEYTDFGSIESYLKSRNYENTEDFKKDMDERIIINLDIDKKEEELRKMSEEHPETEITGGKTL